MDRFGDRPDDGLVSEIIHASTSVPAKRVHRTAEEKRRIVEATLVPGASIARVARDNRVNANQVFQWRYEYKNGVGWAVKQPHAKLLPVTLSQNRLVLLCRSCSDACATFGIHPHRVSW